MAQVLGHLSCAGVIARKIRWAAFRVKVTPPLEGPVRPGQNGDKHRIEDEVATANPLSIGKGPDRDQALADDRAGP